MTEILLGAASWLSSDGDDPFYPEDLPEDWQLTFYANEYGTVLLSCEQLEDESYCQAVCEQLQDCHERFRPVLQVNIDKCQPHAVARVLDQIAAIDDELGLQRLAGAWLYSASGAPMDAQVWRGALPADLPLAISGAAGVSLPNTVPTCRLGDSVPESTWLASLNLGDLDNRQLSSALQQLQSGSPLPYSCLIVTGGYQKLDNLAELATLIRLIQG